MAKPVVVQLGRGTTQPFQFLFFFCNSSKSAWSSFIPGISIGTSSSYLYADEVLITGMSLANLVSISLAAPDSIDIKIRSNWEGSISSIVLTVISLIYSGISPPTSHLIMPLLGSLMASMYFLPADLSDAAICVTSNHGCSFKDWTNSCPTDPVTPIIATLFFTVHQCSLYLIILSNRPKPTI